MKFAYALVNEGWKMGMDGYYCTIVAHNPAEAMAIFCRIYPDLACNRGYSIIPASRIVGKVEVH